MKTDIIYDPGFCELDCVFARFMQKLSGNSTEELFLAAMLLSCSTRNGHICIQLSDMAGKTLRLGEIGHDMVTCPDPGHWQNCLEATDVVGRPGDFRPMILDGQSRLYLYRYWDYEKRLIDDIRQRINDKGCLPEKNTHAIDFPEIDKPLLRNGLSRLFPSDPGAGVDWQKVAALSAVLNNFTVISGSPGTGKTTTVAKIIGLLLEQAKGIPLRIALAAPTGKAAVRLQEAISKAKETLRCAENIRSAIPEKTSTVHRLLGSVSRSPYFRHDGNNPIPYDVVIVDEASMIALPLFSKLVQAIHPRAKLIILGDKDQLASVEAGAILGDICGSENPNAFSSAFANRIRSYVDLKIEADSRLNEQGVHDCIVSLEQNFRYGEASGIARLSAAVNSGDGAAAWEVLNSEAHEDVRRIALPKQSKLQDMLQEAIGDHLSHFLQAVQEGQDPVEIFDRFETFRILCALRQGRCGVVDINNIIEDMLRKGRFIKSESHNYPGRPVMVTKNDYNMGLFNGDIGIMIRDSDAPEGLRAVFRDSGGGIRRFHPLRLPEHETAYAMTIHKSQGSEYNRVLILLPDRDNPVLTRELIYTAVTRAKVLAEVCTDEAIFRAAISRKIERTSGLKDALWGVMAETGNNPQE